MPLACATTPACMCVLVPAGIERLAPCAERKLVELGWKEAEDRLKLEAPVRANWKATALKTRAHLTKAQKAMPWLQDEVFDAAWLDARDFRPKRGLERAWTPDDVERLRQGFAQLQAGTDLLPSRRTDPLYYLGHHVMGKGFSEKACERQLMRMYEEGVRTQAAPLAEGVTDDFVAGMGTLSMDALDVGATAEGSDPDWSEEDEDARIL